MTRVCLPNHGFARGLRLAVDAERRDRIGLYVGALFRAVENIIRRYLDDRHLVQRRGPRDRFRSHGIGGVGRLRLGFRFVHGGIGRRIENKARLNSEDRGRDGVEVRDIGSRAMTTGHFDIAGSGERDHFVPKLTCGAKNEDRPVHATVPSRSPR